MEAADSPWVDSGRVPSSVRKLPSEGWGSAKLVSAALLAVAPEGSGAWLDDRRGIVTVDVVGDVLKVRGSVS